MRTARTQKRHRKKRTGYMRRSIFFTIIFAVVITFGTYNGSEEVSAHGSSGRSHHHKYYKSIEVTAGDTLWDIAEEYMDESYDSMKAVI